MTATRNLALERLREGLHVSVSQAKTYLLCPAKHAHTYILGTPPSHRPAALAFGSAVHHALAVFYEGLMDHGRKPEKSHLQAAFVDRWEVETSEHALPLRFEDGQDAGTVLDQGVALLSAFHDRGFMPDRVLAVEQPFSVPLPDPDTGVIRDEALVGAIDLVAEHQGRVVLVEHKTAARRLTPDRLLHDPQPTAYRFAARSLGLREPALVFQCLMKFKKPLVEFTPITRTDDQELEMLDTFGQVLKGIRAGVFPRNRGWACGDCPYGATC